MEKLKDRKVFFKCMLLLVGSVVSGIGIGVTVDSTKSGDAVTFLWEAIANKLCIDITIANYIFTIILLIIVLVFNKEKLGVATVAIPVLQNVGIKLFEYSGISFCGRLNDYIIFFVGLLVMAIGYGVAAGSHMGLSVYLSFVEILSDKLKIKFSKMMVISDGLNYLFAFLISRRLATGPFIAFLLGGPILAFAREKTENALDKME